MGQGRSRGSRAHLRWDRRTSTMDLNGPQGSGTAALIEVVFRKGLGLRGIELGGLVEVEVVREGFLGGLFSLLTVGPHGPHGPHVELGLRGPSGGMEERG